jgi:hypothetical protein
MVVDVWAQPADTISWLPEAEALFRKSHSPVFEWVEKGLKLTPQRVESPLGCGCGCGFGFSFIIACLFFFLFVFLLLFSHEAHKSTNSQYFFSPFSQVSTILLPENK